MDLLDQGVDLLHFFQRKLSLRRLLLYIRHLPDSSRVVKHQMGAVAQWDRSDYLQALIVDEIKYSNYLLQAANWNGKGNAPELPEPLKRPSDDPDPKIEPEVAEPKKFLTAAEMRAWKEEVSTPTVILYE